MKRFLKGLLIAVLAALTVFGMTACADGSGDSSEKGLLYKKFSGDNYYTVYDYNEDDKTKTLLNLNDYNKDGVSIGRIKEGAFDGNDFTTEIILPESVVTIDAGAFKGMTKLQKITIPFVGANRNSDAFLGESADSGDKAVDAERVFAYIFGTESYVGGTAVTANYGSSTATYYLPHTLDSVEVINSNADTAYSIPMYAFSGVKQLYNITLTGNIDAIGSFAFENCECLDKLVLSKNIKYIYDSAFVGTTNLKGLDFTDIALEKIGAKAFEKSNLTELKVSVKEIGDYAFAASKLTKIEISGITKVGNYAFYDCEDLVVDAAVKTALEAIGGQNVFSK